MKDKADMMYSMYDGASHMGSQAVDKMINAYLEKSKLMARLPNEDDPSEKKVIKEQIKKQEEIIKTKAIELNEKKEDLESTPEGKIVAEAVIEARQKALNEKITENNSKKSRPKIKAVSIINLIEKKQEKREAEEKQEDRIEDKKNPKDTLLSRLSKEEKKTFSKVCEVIDNEPTLTPSYMESLKTKILKKLAK
jgi:hypothetical protein